MLKKSECNFSYPNSLDPFKQVTSDHTWYTVCCWDLYSYKLRIWFITGSVFRQ
uniref:Uncharacterized protein n=1 Tax=Anguilla anguilla TaxID=7936 RepID=A0A0E9TN96_ANGAN